MKRSKGWALYVALQVGACGMAGCNTAPPLPAVGSQASVQPEQSVEQMMAAARFMENQGVPHGDAEKLEIARQGYMTVLTRVPNNQFAHHRLAIMAAGRLRCLGSPQHLKARFGAGYMLDLRLGSGRELPPVTSTVQELVPGAELTQATETSAAYSLPREVRSTMIAGLQTEPCTHSKVA